MALYKPTKDFAQQSEWKIKPIDIDGKAYYVAVWHPEAYDLFRKAMARNGWYRKQHLKRWLKYKQHGVTFIEA